MRCQKRGPGVGRSIVLVIAVLVSIVVASALAIPSSSTNAWNPINAMTGDPATYPAEPAFHAPDG